MSKEEEIEAYLLNAIRSYLRHKDKYMREQTATSKRSYEISEQALRQKIVLIESMKGTSETQIFYDVILN